MISVASSNKAYWVLPPSPVEKDMSRVHIEEQFVLAEHLANERQQPLLAFLVLYHLLLQRGKGSDGMPRQATLEGGPNISHRPQGLRGHGEILQPCLEASCWALEVQARVRAAELLLWSEYACLDTAGSRESGHSSAAENRPTSPSPRPSSPLVRPPMGRQATQEGAELAMNLLAPLFPNHNHEGVPVYASLRHRAYDGSFHRNQEHRHTTGSREDTADVGYSAMHRVGHSSPSVHRVVSAILLPAEAFALSVGGGTRRGNNNTKVCRKEKGEDATGGCVCFFAAASATTDGAGHCGDKDSEETEEEVEDGVPALSVIKAHLLLALAARRRGAHPMPALKQSLAILQAGERWLSLLFANEKVQSDERWLVRQLLRRFQCFGDERAPPTTSQGEGMQRSASDYAIFAQHLTHGPAEGDAVDIRKQVHDLFSRKVTRSFRLCQALLYTELSRTHCSACFYMSRQPIDGIGVFLASRGAASSSASSASGDATTVSRPTNGRSLSVAPQELKSKMGELAVSLRALALYASLFPEIQQHLRDAGAGHPPPLVSIARPSQVNRLSPLCPGDRDEEAVEVQVLTACAESLAYFRTQSYFLALETGIDLPPCSIERAKTTLPSTLSEGSGVVRHDVASGATKEETLLSLSRHLELAARTFGSGEGRAEEAEFSLLWQLFACSGAHVTAGLPASPRTNAGSKEADEHHDKRTDHCGEGDAAVNLPSTLPSLPWLSTEVKRSLAAYLSLRRLIDAGGRPRRQHNHQQQQQQDATPPKHNIIPFIVPLMEVEREFSHVLSCIDAGLLAIGGGGGGKQRMSSDHAPQTARTEPTEAPDGFPRAGMKRDREESATDTREGTEKTTATGDDRERSPALLSLAESGTQQQRPRLLSSSPFTQTRFLIQLKASAITGAATFALTNLFYLSAVRHIHKGICFLQAFRGHFAVAGLHTLPHRRREGLRDGGGTATPLEGIPQPQLQPTAFPSSSLPHNSSSSSSTISKHGNGGLSSSRPLVELHLLIASLCMHLSIRDIGPALQQFLADKTSLRDRVSSNGHHNGTRKEKEEEAEEQTRPGSFGYFHAYEEYQPNREVLLDVGLPYYHLHAAEELHLSSLAAITRMNPSLVNSSSNRTNRHQPHHEPQGGEDPVVPPNGMGPTLLTIKLLKTLAMYQVAAAEEKVALAATAPRHAEGSESSLDRERTSYHYRVSPISLSQRHRCSAAVGEVLEKLAEHYDAATSKGKHESVPASSPTWTPGNTALYFLLQACYALTEGKDDVSAEFYLRGYLRSVSASSRGGGNGVGGVFVADALQQLASIAHGHLAAAGGRQGMRKGGEGEDPLPVSAASLSPSLPKRESDYNARVDALATQSCARGNGLALCRLWEEKYGTSTAGLSRSVALPDSRPANDTGGNSNNDKKDEPRDTTDEDTRRKERVGRDIMTEWRALQLGMLAGSIPIEEVHAATSREVKKEGGGEPIPDQHNTAHAVHHSNMKRRLQQSLFATMKPTTIPGPTHFLEVLSFLPHTPGYGKLQE